MTYPRNDSEFERDYGDFVRKLFSQFGVEQERLDEVLQGFYLFSVRTGLLGKFDPERGTKFTTWLHSVVFQHFLNINRHILSYPVGVTITSYDPHSDDDEDFSDMWFQETSVLRDRLVRDGLEATKDLDRHIDVTTLLDIIERHLTETKSDGRPTRTHLLDKEYHRSPLIVFQLMRKGLSGTEISTLLGCTTGLVSILKREFIKEVKEKFGEHPFLDWY